MDIRIEGGRVLIDGRLADAAIEIDAATGTIAEIAGAPRSRRALDAQGLLVLPGIVDIHGDAFERQMMPRPGVDFAVDLAMRESDRQAIGNGITTVFHGVTWSWEPGLRGPDNARAVLDALERLEPHLSADTRFHLRYETFNLEAEPEVIGWLRARRVHVLGFNDHLSPIFSAPDPARKLEPMLKRSGVSRDAFMAVVERARSRAAEVPDSVRRIAEAARAGSVALLSHDDASPEQRRWYRALGCRLAEFPMTMETARDAADAQDDIVLGAPNVVRGKSHMGWIDATEMIARGLCSVLASDYYYPTQLLAAFRLAAKGVLPLERAWDLIAHNPARAAGLTDRGRVAVGSRADLILVDARDALHPVVVAAIVRGRIVYLTQAERIEAPSRAARPGQADAELRAG